MLKRQHLFMERRYLLRFDRMHLKDGLLREYKDLGLPNDGEEYATKRPSSSNIRVFIGVYSRRASKLNELCG